MLPSICLVLIGASLLSFAHAAPRLLYSLMAQEPPVARVGKLFNFDLFPETFNSSSGITYTTSSLPSWLTWNTPSLAFTGTPAASDVGSFPIILTATDATGSISSNWTLLVSNYSIPGIHQSFTTQIAKPDSRVFASATALPGGTGVSIPPYWSFSLGFAYDTFRLSRTEPINGDLFIMAHERGTIALPQWLAFDNETMTFNGVAPSNGSYTIVATGTDYWGYTGAQTSFVISVGEGDAIEMSKGTNFSDVVTMARNTINYDISTSNILYGGQAVLSRQIAFAINSAGFSWLSVEGTTLKGTTPDDYLNGTTASLFIPLTISATNTSNTNTLLTWIPLDVLPYFFTNFTLPTASVDPSSTLTFDLNSYVVDKKASINATVNPSEAASWLTYHQNNLTLVGTAPKDPQYDHVNVTFAASEGSNTATSSLQIVLNGVTAHSGTNGTAAVPSESGSHGGLSKGAKIGLGVGLGVLGLIILALLLFCCCRRRKNSVSERKMDDADSFVAGSPVQDPFRRSNGLDAPRNLLGEIARFSGLHIKHSEELEDKPTRMDGLKGIFGWSDEKDANIPAVVTPRLTQSSSSFLGHGDVIGVADPVNRPSQDASSFTQSFSSSSRASWESRESFQWSDADVQGATDRNRESTTPSIPRPRQDFTPRYPRNNSPTRLAQLASQHSLGMPVALSSESESLSGTFSGSDFGSNFPSGPSGLNRFGDSGFKSIDEDEEDTTSTEGPAVVSMAERQQVRPTPKLRPSRERIASPSNEPHKETSRQALNDVEDGMYDDADEYRRSMMGGEVQGLGYPASAIFGSPMSDGRSVRSSTIRAIPAHENPLSPPLPQVGSFVRPTSLEVSRPLSGSNNDGRVIACANETFSIHPQIHPPPTVSLSAATWSSAPPSTYRAEVVGGGQLPSWLHFDARELELWGVPSLKHAGETTIIRIIEKLPRENRRSDPTAFGYEPQQEREVGKIIVEVVDRVRSPQFALEGSPHAF